MNIRQSHVWVIFRVYKYKTHSYVVAIFQVYKCKAQVCCNNSGFKIKTHSYIVVQVRIYKYNVHSCVVIFEVYKYMTHYLN